MSRDEIVQTITAVTKLLNCILTQHIKLAENLSDQGFESQKWKLDSLKAKLAKEKLKLAKLRRVAKRKRDLEKANRHIPCNGLARQ